MKMRRSEDAMMRKSVKERDYKIYASTHLLINAYTHLCIYA